MSVRIYPPLRIAPTTWTDADVIAVEPDWSLQFAYARSYMGLVNLNLYITYQGADIVPTPGSSNIPDTRVGTITEPFRPGEAISFVWGTGFQSGEAAIAASGAFTIRDTDTDQAITAGRNFRFTTTYFLPFPEYGGT